MPADRIRVILSRRRPKRLRCCCRRCARGRRTQGCLGRSSGTKIVLHAARLTSIKGQRDLIAAAAALASAEGRAPPTLWSFSPATRRTRCLSRGAARTDRAPWPRRQRYGSSGIAGEMPRGAISHRRSRSPRRRCRRAFGRTSAGSASHGLSRDRAGSRRAAGPSVARDKAKPAYRIGCFRRAILPRSQAASAGRLPLTGCGRAAIGDPAREHVAANFHAGADARGDACRLRRAARQRSRPSGSSAPHQQTLAPEVHDHGRHHALPAQRIGGVAHRIRRKEEVGPNPRFANREPAAASVPSGSPGRSPRSRRFHLSIASREDLSDSSTAFGSMSASAVPAKYMHRVS